MKRSFKTAADEVEPPSTEQPQRIKVNRIIGISVALLKLQQTARDPET
jgi:hypothetical protein